MRQGIFDAGASRFIRYVGLQRIFLARVVRPIVVLERVDRCGDQADVTYSFAISGTRTGPIKADGAFNYVGQADTVPASHGPPAVDTRYTVEASSGSGANPCARLLPTTRSTCTPGVEPSDVRVTPATGGSLEGKAGGIL